MSLELARKIADANTTYARWPFGAVVTKGGAVQAVGWNSLKSDPAYLDGQPWRSVHCEMHVLRQMNFKAKGCILYVARALKGGGVGLAKPCPSCRKEILASGIKRVVYTLDETNYGVWKTNQERV